MALSLFNVYGPGQSLSNPYTGVVAIFAARLMANLAPLVFEDGAQTRDFAHFEDVAAACVTVLERPKVNGLGLNVGTRRATKIGGLARLVRGIVSGPEPVFTGRYRPGDIRQYVADAMNATRFLGWKPSVELEAGLAEMTWWFRSQRAPKELLDRPFVEPQRVGLPQ